MKKTMIASFLVIALVAAVVGGASMAWFTAKQDVPENVFVAGTVMIEAGKEFVWDAEKMDNVNPGDCFSKCIQVYNTGTKAIELRLVNMKFSFVINWDWICRNWDALCFSKVLDDAGENRWANCNVLRLEVATALEQGQVTNPAEAEGQGYGPFDDQGRLIVPIMSALCPDSGWIMKYIPATNSVVFFYAGGPLAPGEVTELCVMVKFDGPWMGNLWQGATFTIGGGEFQAVQASNNAPQEVWGQAVWDNYQAVKNAGDAKAQLAHSFGAKYADYFYDAQGNFLFTDCCLATARVTTQAELNAALANPEIKRIKLYGTFDGFFVRRGDIVIQGGTVIPTNLAGETVGIYLTDGVTGVVIDGVTFVGDDGVVDRGILATGGTKAYTVRNSTFVDLTTGIYANSDMFIGRELTATGNTFTNCFAGIGGTENTLLHRIESNTFVECEEGIGLGGGVSSSIVADVDIFDYLKDNNTFDACTVDVADYR